MPILMVEGCSRQQEAKPNRILKIKAELVDSKIHQLSLKLYRTRQISTGLPNQVDKLSFQERRSVLANALSALLEP